MTTTPTTTTYYVSIPLVTTANLQIELPVGLTNDQVLELINWEATRHIDYDHKAIRLAALDSVEKREVSIEIEADD